MASIDFTTVEVWTKNGLVTFYVHDHAERNHQGLDNELIGPIKHPPDLEHKIETTERLGGMLRSYRRAA